MAQYLHKMKTRHRVPSKQCVITDARVVSDFRRAHPTGVYESPTQPHWGTSWEPQTRAPTGVYESPKQPHWGTRWEPHRRPSYPANMGSLPRNMGSRKSETTRCRPQFLGVEQIAVGDELAPEHGVKEVGDHEVSLPILGGRADRSG